MYIITERPEYFKEIGWDNFAETSDVYDHFEGKDGVEFDIETNGLGFMFSKIWCTQFGDFDEQFIVDIPTINILEYKKLLTEKEIFIHKSDFELPFMYACGIIIPMDNVRDTFPSEKSLTLGKLEEKNSLAACVKKYFDIELSKDEQLTIIDTGLDRLEHIEYSGLDVKYLQKIYDAQTPLLAAQGLNTREIDNKFTSPMSYIEYCGMYRDPDKVYQLVRDIEYEEWGALKALNKYFEDNYPDLREEFPNLNWASSKQVAEAFKIMGIDVQKKDKETVDIKHLKPQSEEFPIIQKLIDYKGANKLVTTYGRSWDEYVMSDKRIHTKYRALVDTGRTASGDTRKKAGRKHDLKPFPNCLSIDTQVLTKEGWKFHNELKEDDIVAAWDYEIFWETPTNYIFKEDQECVRLHSKHLLDIVSTADHRTLLYHSKKGKYLTLPAKDALNKKKEWSIKNACELLYNNNVAEYSNAFIKVSVSMRRLGYWNNGFTIQILGKEDLDLEQQFLDAELPYSKAISTNKKLGQTFVNYKVEENDLIRGTCFTGAKYGYELLDMSMVNRRVFIDEIRSWLIFNGSAYWQDEADVIQAVACTVGVRCYQREIKGEPRMVSLTFEDNEYSLLKYSSISPVENQDVWCIEVPSEYFLARRNGKTFITGNCQNIPKEERFRSVVVGQGPNHIITADYSGQESVILADISEDPDLLAFYRSGEADLHSFTAQKMYPDKLDGMVLSEIKSNFGDLRQSAKEINFLLAYGGTVWGLADKLGTTKEAAQALLDLYFEKFGGLKAFFDEQRLEAIRKGHILIPSKYGRKRYVSNYAELKDQIANKKSLSWPEQRKLESVLGQLERLSLNTPIQGLASEVTKTAMIYMYEEIIKRKWFGKVKMINMVHDEIVLEAHQKTCPKVAPILEECMIRAGDDLLNHLSLKVDVVIKKEWSK